MTIRVRVVGGERVAECPSCRSFTMRRRTLDELQRDMISHGRAAHNGWYLINWKL